MWCCILSVHAQVKIDKRTLTFDVSAHDGIESIGSGQHQRVIVDTQRFLAKTADKSKQLAAESKQDQGIVIPADLLSALLKSFENMQRRGDDLGSEEAEMLRILKHVDPDQCDLKTRLIAAQV